MPVITLGLSGELGYDAAAALFIDGEVVAAVEEERLVRRKHARGMMPVNAVRYCLRSAKLKPRQIDQVAISYAPVSIFGRARWHYAARMWYAPDRALDALFNGNRRYRRYVKRVKAMLAELAIPWEKVRFVPVEHQLAHAASAYNLSGFKGKTAILSLDLRGEYATTLFAYGENGRIHKIKELYEPDSLKGLYGAMCDYLGFDSLDGETKVMGIATYGNAEKYDLSFLADYSGKDFRINTRMIRTVGLRRYKQRSVGYPYSEDFIDQLGPRRAGDVFQDPYVHYAAAMQKLHEKITTGLVTHYLADVLKENGQLVIAGMGAFNVKLNRRLLDLPWVKQLYVQPMAGDAGTAIGAAAYAISKQNIEVGKLRHTYLGPRFTTDQCIRACKAHRDRPVFEILDSPAEKAAELLAEGHLVAWFQGRMEFGPRALGNRSILGNPRISGSVQEINQKVKFREKWRAFSPSMLESLAKQMLDLDHAADFMTISFDVVPEWRELFPAVVYKDGTTRAHVVRKASNPRFHAVLEAMEKKTGYGIVLNTSLNRPGEAMICSPEDALDMFHGSDLEYMIMQDVLVTKSDDEVQGW
ncbi:carbamoyltransferase C-terminal domain-containing protein [Pseudohongiella sp. SYSU M77423]|uniref:carbamoyltransferase family protein n=1 Tax=unclassified Pseudohongiella TaxID=2629611 RepID=UPI001F1F84AE|nr:MULTISPECIES: carbamoyltransferase C-terminal domain-containing protein [unclassified Pseudohongiella]MDH7942853.1 carbamoyltransferase C-terminal domain-containing protein [Pseudohongiella sp. SYSU M77423]